MRTSRLSINLSVLNAVGLVAGSEGVDWAKDAGPGKRLALNNHFTEMCSGSEVGSYLRPMDSCITQLKAQGPSRTFNESKEEEETDRYGVH